MDIANDDDNHIEKVIFKCSYCDKILSSKRNLEIHEYNICKYVFLYSSKSSSFIAFSSV